ncbi:adenylate/guanylate cyclase domain-containing protein [Oscillatoria sp. FACHB-1406]|nr:adenylate/guanylate cyclase domain-containing protein [Oscillatoria sp. FACHB-1406]
MQRWDRQMQVSFYRWRGPIAPPSEVVILAIDEDSLNQGNLAAKAPDRYPELAPLYRFPWQRQAYGQAISRLLAAGARSVSVDILLTSPSSYGNKDDLALRQSLEKAGGRVVLAAAHEYSGSDGGLQHHLVKPNPLFLGSSRLGLINFFPDVDGRIYHLANNYGDRVLRPLGLEALPSFADATLQAAQLPPTQYGEIFYYGGRNTFPYVPFWQVIDNKNWEFHRKNGTFQDKIVLIGATADSLQDFKRTPFSERMPGVEVHANAIATLLRGLALWPLVPDPGLRGVFVFLGVGAIAIVLLRWKNPLWQCANAGAIALGWIAVTYICFHASGMILPILVPAIALTLYGITALAVGILREQLERLRLYNTLGRYVAEPIVNEILNRHADDFRSLVKGRKVKAAILFSDIRSFTTFSLTREPEEVVEQLNVYLEAMVEAILAEGGTLDKFIGDAVMAEFGSPISYGEKENTLRAVRAALGMRKALVQLQQEWREQGKEILFNGIGIHYGEVIAGDIGSSKRREFAVIGDTVNVASRIEGLTGKLSVDILISEALYEWVRDEIEVVEMGLHSLKGRGDNKIKLYSVVGLKAGDRQLYRQMREALRQYLDFRQRSDRASG